MTNRVLIIDGDPPLYQVATAQNQEVTFGDDLVVSGVDLELAVTNLEDLVGSYMEYYDADEMVFTVTDTAGNWRNAIYPKYKAARKKKSKPTALPYLRNWVKDKWDAIRKPLLEADDVVGIYLTNKHLWKGFQKVALSIDKDLHTIPGLHVNPMKEGSRPKLITEEAANYNHLYQTLIGDAVDNYPGCPGIGPVKATAFLDEGATWNNVVKAYQSKDLGAREALIQAQIARICRASDFNYKEQKVIPWTPSPS